MWYYVFNVVGLVLLVISLVAIPRYILGPAAERVRTSRAHTQFLLSDLIWLVLLVQIGMAPLTVLLGDAPFAALAVIGTLAFLLITALWWFTIRMVARTGVRSQLRRGLLVVVVVPLTLAMIVVWPMACISLSKEVFFPYLNQFADTDWRLVWRLTPLVLVPFPLAWLLRRVVLWGLNDPARVESAETEIDLEPEESS